MPSSIAAAACPARSRSSVSGRPIALLRLPSVASTRASPKCARRIAASISLTVVLPLLPTTTMTGIANRARQCAASAPSAAQRVRHRDQVARERAGAVRGDQRGGGAALERGADEVVPVEALALERDEQIARRERARVGGHAREAHVRAQRCGRATARAAVAVSIMRRSTRASAAAAASASENGVRTPSRSW